MEHLQNRFNEIYEESKELDIYFIDDTPLTIKRVRYNQGGTVCFCMLNKDVGKEKLNNKWTEKECLDTCEYRAIKNSKKPLCNIEATLKFMIPKVSKDRIWYLKTTSYYSIQNISSYITLQNKLGNSLIGNYKLFLKPKENIVDGMTFNNFVLDLVKIENFNSNEISNQKSKKISKQLSKENNSKKTTSTSNIKSIPIPKSLVSEPTEEDLKRYYVLLDSEIITLNKEGISTDYLQAKFCDKDSKEVIAIIHPKYADDMSKCELGSQFLLDIEKFGERQIVRNCEYLVKQIKEAV